MVQAEKPPRLLALLYREFQGRRAWVKEPGSPEGKSKGASWPRRAVWEAQGALSCHSRAWHARHTC